MATNHVVTTSAFSATIGKLNMLSQAALIMEMEKRAREKRDLVDTQLHNQLTAVAAQAAEALQKAQILDDFEKGQLEEAFMTFLSTSGLETLLSAMSVTIDGDSYSVDSVLKAIIAADKIAEEDFAFGPTGDLTSAQYKLQDGYLVNMTYTKQTLPTGDIRFTGSSNDWRGLTVEESFTIRPIKQTVTLEGAPFETVVDNQLIARKHIQFDLTPLFDVAQTVTAAVSDLNNNSVIGS